MSDHPKDLHARVPVNRTAANVIGPGEAFQPLTGWMDEWSDTPLPIRTEVQNPPHEDLTGRRVGWLAVLGLSATHGKRWVCRCACGRYVMRKARALKQTLGDGGDRCGWCEKTRNIRKASRFRATGQWSEEVSA